MIFLGSFFVDEGGILDLDEGLEGGFSDAQAMDDHFEDFGELLLADEVLVEAEFLDGPE